VTRFSPLENLEQSKSEASFDLLLQTEFPELLAFVFLRSVLAVLKQFRVGKSFE
jgi:hypothetical protein